jgi:hypothetical protein
LKTAIWSHLPGRADHRHRRALSLPAGIQRIVARTPVPVVPMALRGLWGSFFSRKGGRAMSNPLHLRPFSKVGLVASAARAATQKLREKIDLYERLMRLDKPIGILLLLWPTLWALWFSAEGWPPLAWWCGSSCSARC